MFFFTFSQELKDYYVVPTKWVFDFDIAKHVNNSLNRNQKHLIYTTNKADAYFNGEPNNKWHPNFEAPLVTSTSELPINIGSEYVFHGYLVKCFSE